MRGSSRKLADDFGRRDVGDLDARQPGDCAAIVARPPPLHEFEAGASGDIPAVGAAIAIDRLPARGTL